MLNVPDQFEQVTANGETLIYARPTTEWTDWQHRWLRSLHLRADGSVISVGWPKFLDMGQGLGEYRTEVHHLRENIHDLIATTKIDGSLLIRFVRDGKVCFRTRGSLQVGVKNADEIDEFVRKYPRLMDPVFCVNKSVLFEWVSPANRIVIKYPAPNITLIGAVSFAQNAPWWEAKFRLLTINELSLLAESLGVPLVEWYRLEEPRDVDALLSKLSDNQEMEGFVLRFGQKLSRVKTDWYKLLHYVRSNLATKSILELWFDKDKPDKAIFEEMFKDQFGIDMLVDAKQALEDLYAGIRSTNEYLSRISDFVEVNRNMTDKDFAFLVKDSGFVPPVCFNFRRKKEINQRLLFGLIMERTKQHDLRMFAEKP